MRNLYVCNAGQLPYCYVSYPTMNIENNTVGPITTNKSLSKDDAKFYLDKLEEYYNLCEYADPNCARAKALRDILVKAGVM